MNEYMTPQEAAEKWHTGLRRVQYFCANDKIPGVRRIGRQWFIPKNARKPEDERLRGAKETNGKIPYHFPALIYTKYYVDELDLNEEEKTLLTAQKLYLQGELSQCVELCRQLIERSENTNVIFGAYLSNALCYQILGMVSKLIVCMDEMEKIFSEEKEHIEDYRLLIAFCKYLQTYSQDYYHRINIRELSESALLAYEIFTLGLAVLSPAPESFTAFSLYTARCEEIGHSGITPLHFVYHTCLGCLLGKSGDREGYLFHQEEACRIGYENKLVTLLSKYSTIAPEEYSRFLQKFNVSFAREIEIIHENNYRNVHLTFLSLTGKINDLAEDLPENEFILLLFYNMSNRDIALLKNISEKEVREIIKEMCEKNGLKTKKELVEKYRKIYDEMIEASPQSR